MIDVWVITKSDSYLSTDKDEYGVHKACSKNLKSKAYFFDSQSAADTYLKELRAKGQKWKGWRSKKIELAKMQKEELKSIIAGDEAGFLIYKGTHVIETAGNSHEPVSYTNLKGSPIISYEDAYKLLLELQAKGMCKKWHIMEIKKADGSSVQNNILNQLPVSNVKVINKEIVASGEVDDVFLKMEEHMGSLAALQDKYMEELSEIERCLVDYYHYIEFSELDGVRGYKAYYIQKNLLKKRRELKDNLEKISLMTGISSAITRTKCAFLQIQNRTYTPRFSNTMFLNNDSGMECKNNRYKNKDAKLLEKLFDCFKEDMTTEGILNIMK